MHLPAEKAQRVAQWILATESSCSRSRKRSNHNDDGDEVEDSDAVHYATETLDLASEAPPAKRQLLNILPMMAPAPSDQPEEGNPKESKASIRTLPTQDPGSGSPRKWVHGDKGSEPVPKRRGFQNVGDLARLENPVKFEQLSNADEQLLPDVRMLHNRIFDVVFFSRGFIPSQVRAEFIATSGAHLAQDVIFKAPSDATDTVAAAELEALSLIVSDAIYCQEQVDLECGWNFYAHSPMLRLAVDGTRPTSLLRANTDAHRPIIGAVQEAPIDIQSAPKSREPGGRSFIASVAGSSAFSQASVTAHYKKVDYVIALRPKIGSTLEDKVHAVYSMFDFFNQTPAGSLQWSPIAVSIEMKLPTSSRDPLVQLGIWTAAAFRKMGSIIGSKPFELTLLAISVLGHTWDLYYVSMRDNCIMMHGPQFLGSTRTLYDAYKLLESLRLIREWISHDFAVTLEAILNMAASN